MVCSTQSISLVKFPEPFDRKSRGVAKVEKSYERVASGISCTAFIFCCDRYMTTMFYKKLFIFLWSTFKLF